MRFSPKLLLALALLLPTQWLAAERVERVVDIPTRTGVSMRMLVLKPAAPKAAVLLLAGGHGGLQIFPGGSMKWGDGNFLVRTRRLFADQDLMVAVVDAPSDRQRPPYLSGFRQSADHVADIKAAMDWLRSEAKVPVWLVGTSRGTQSAAHVAVQVQGPSAPDGVVLASSILRDERSPAVSAMALERIQRPVLVVHHVQDGCAVCSYADVPALMDKLKGNNRSQLMAFQGGQNVGDPCHALAYHGFNGIESQVVQQIAGWILAR